MPHLLRQQLLATRRALSTTQRASESAAVCATLCQLFAHHPDGLIAAYHPLADELSPQDFVNTRIHAQQPIFMPLIDDIAQRRLRFAPITAHTRWQRNKWNINEPFNSPSQPAYALQVILLPLVGYNRFGDRLGMGGGFYDTTLANPHTRPWLIGLAFNSQYSDAISAQPHDVPLHAVITNQGITYFNNEVKRWLIGS